MNLLWKGLAMAFVLSPQQQQNNNNNNNSNTNSVIVAAETATTTSTDTCSAVTMDPSAWKYSSTTADRSYCDQLYGIVEMSGLAFLIQNAFTAPKSDEFVRDLWKQFPSQPSAVKNQLAVVTGVSLNSIGYYIAEELALGAEMDLILLGRSMDRLTQAETSIVKARSPTAARTNIYKVLMDLNDLTKMPTTAEQVKEIVAAGPQYNGKIHVLINSAGVHDLTYEPTVQGMDPNAGRNLVANLALTHLLLPVLRKKQDDNDSNTKSRVVMVATAGHCAGRMFSPDRFLENPAHGGAPDGMIIEKKGKTVYAKAMTGTDLYHQSKMGMIAATKALALQEPSISFTSVHPGSVLSNFGSKLGAVGAIYYNLFYLFQFSAKQGAVSSLRAALDPTAVDLPYLHCNAQPWTTGVTTATDPTTSTVYDMNKYNDRCLQVVKELIAKYIPLN